MSNDAIAGSRGQGKPGTSRWTAPLRSIGCSYNSTCALSPILLR